MKKLWAYFYVSLVLAVVALLAQNSAVRTPTILDQRQMPPIVGAPGPTGPQGPQGPAGPPGTSPQMNWGEALQPGTAPNTWTLSKPVTSGINVFWNGDRQSIGGTFIFTGNGNGGTLLTLTPVAVAAGFWTGTDLVADYQ